MALLSGTRLRVTTTAGVPVNGGWVRFRETGTSTLATIYTDAALSIASANPLQAASDGWTPNFYAADGLAVDVAFFQNDNGSLGAEITGNAMTAAVFSATSGTTFTRDFGAGGRAQIRGSSDTVYFEGGNPTGDNSGGNVYLSGWNGSTADSVKLNGPTDVVSDTFTVNSKKLPGVVQTAATTFTAVTNLDIPLTNSPSGVRAWEILIWDLALSTADRLNGRLSYDSGSTYKSGASDYSYSTGNMIKAAGASFTVSSGAGDYLLTTDEQVAAAANGVIKLLVTTVNSGNGFTTINGHVNAKNQTTSAPGLWMANAHGLGNYGRATHLRIFGGTNGATLTGKYRVVGLRGTGE